MFYDFKIQEKLIDPNEYSRPQKPLREVLGIVIHDTGTHLMSAYAVRNYFDDLKKGRGNVHASAHYVIGWQGEIIRCIPDTEVAYHCGSEIADPASGKPYTDYARAHFGKYAEIPTLSPNLCTIGIELCPIDDSGRFCLETRKSAELLCADLCKRHGLGADDITTHHNVVGWKPCPKAWTGDPQLLEVFKNHVRQLLYTGKTIL